MCTVRLSAQITYFGSASLPTADNGTNTTQTSAVTPPANMRSGDLVLLIAQRRASNITTMAISNAGGQQWNALTSLTGTASVSARIFWCRFNGTWTANPSINLGGTECNTVVMHVLRPPSTNYSWTIDANQISGAQTTRTATISGFSTLNTALTIVIAAWFSPDANTWDQLTAGWTNLGASSQYRNASGSLQSATFAYRLYSTPTAVGNVSKRQATSQTDATRTGIVSFYAYRTNMPSLLY
jgi:hypothetical protein